MKKNWSEYLKETSNELWLCLLRLDPSVIKFLLEKWATLRDKRHPSTTSLHGADTTTLGLAEKRLEKLHLFECRFADESSVNCLIHFMILVGNELKELGLSDAFLADEDDFVLDEESIVSLLCGLQKVTSLERLGISHAFLRGTNIGMAFQRLLSCHGGNINDLRLMGCKIDGHMYHSFVTGFQSHTGMQNLVMTDCGIDDRKFDLLVQAVLNSSTSHTLRRLDISKNRITQFSLLGVSRILEFCQRLENLNMNECRQLCGGIEPMSAPYQRFVQALGANTVLTDLGLCSCGISDKLALPIFKALGRNGTLKRLDIRGIENVSKALACCLSQIQGLENLCAHLDLEYAPLRRAVYSNTSLLELNCVLQRWEDDQQHDDEIWCACSDAYVCNILRRNRSLKQVLPRFLANHDNLNATTWPLCALKLLEDNLGVETQHVLSNCYHPYYYFTNNLNHRDPSTLFEFVRNSSLELVSLYSIPNHQT